MTIQVYDGDGTKRGDVPAVLPWRMPEITQEERDIISQAIALIGDGTAVGHQLNYIRSLSKEGVQELARGVHEAITEAHARSLGPKVIHVLNQTLNIVMRLEKTAKKVT